MDETSLTTILAVGILLLVFLDSAWSLIGAVAVIPLASKVPFPI